MAVVNVQRALVNRAAADARPGPPSIARAQERAVAVHTTTVNIAVIRVNRALGHIIAGNTAASVPRVASASKRAVRVLT